MSSNSLGNAARQSVKILQWQLIWIVVMAAIGGMAFGGRAGWSVLVGGGIGSLWTDYMAFTLFRHSLNHGAGLSAASFLVAWLVKLVLTLGLLVIAFRSKAMAPLGLIAGLFGALLAYWASLAFAKSQRKSAAGTAGNGSGKG
ncbi:MAG TPA: ATP synthase subunit I [Povalibacter sp.]|uniref:ATP synthase subunit I n=1 Tax=Povalibacter sp. TaxID=1962978 RepID=UPI002CD25122|nr:ATP synthase subunit I [Povalibacter sp.]HMN47003.1 ATP synthase subunit I [Povalibacter sp.]